MSFHIDIDQVGKQFGEFTALKNFSGTINEGDRISVLGHNGAGKSTLLNMVASLTKPSKGTIHYYLDNNELTENTEIRKQLTYLSHEPMLYPDLTGIENLTFTSRLYGLEAKPELFQELLASVGMSKAGHRLIRNCSRGMQQRLSIARALLPKPRLLLLDEPFSGLDTAGVRRMCELFKNLNVSWLMVTHDMKLGYEMANRFWILRRGKLVHSVAREGLSFEQYIAMSQGNAEEVIPA